MANEISKGRIYRVQQQIDENTINYATFGVNSDNVQMTYDGQNAGALTAFFSNFIELCKQWTNFKSNANFIYYGDTKPTGKTQIKVWYDTSNE